jgi:hypothetical protein
MPNLFAPASDPATSFDGIFYSGNGIQLGTGVSGVTGLFMVSLEPIDRNLKFTIDLNGVADFPRVRLWTPGISENSGIIRARSDPEWYPNTGDFEPCPARNG